MKKDWKYYEEKMNEAFEAGKKEKGLELQKKYIELYREEQKSLPNKGESLSKPGERNSLKVFNTDFDSFNEQYDSIFPTMEKFLKNKDYIVPVSAYDMLDLFMERYFNGQLTLSSDKEKKTGKVDIYLKREDFIDFHNYIKSKLDSHSRYREINKAISIALDRIDDKETGAPVLKIYTRCKLEKPKRSILDILNQDVSLRYEVDQKTFYNWVDYFNEALKKLEYEPLK